MIFTLLLFIQDTLSNVYGTKWDGSESVTESNTLISLLASGNLAYVVFGVILIIFIAISIYLLKMDKKLDKLEKELNI